MQDRYAADVGDFLKFSLLRSLVAERDSPAPNRLGVVWYRVPDEAHNEDGKHLAYLSEQNEHGRRLRTLDPDLFDMLGGVIARGDRSVAALEDAGVLPAGSQTYRSALSFGHLTPAARFERMAHRRAWLAGALEAVEDCDLVFVDPDNGVRRTDHRTPSHRTKSVKHAYFGELKRFTERGQSIIAYHHADRSAPVEVQAQRRLADAAEELGIAPLAAVSATRGTVRLFLVLPAPAHRETLKRRLADFEARSSRKDFTIYWLPT